VKKIGMQIRDKVLLYGTICPECVLRGPKGAAKRLNDRLLARMDEPSGALRRSGWKKIGRLQVLTALKVAALEETDSFPLEARQAAVRELREKR